MILLMKDHLNLDLRVHSITGLEVSEEMFGGEAHILFAHGARAKRISYSTSHSETLQPYLVWKRLPWWRYALLSCSPRSRNLLYNNLLLFKKLEYPSCLWMP